MSDFHVDNPYEALYRGLNLQVSPQTSKADAEEIARQLGFMHNAFGVVAKDLIKLLSIKFANEPTTTSHQQNVSAENTGKNKPETKEKDQHEMEIQNLGGQNVEGPKLSEAGIVFNKKQKNQVVVDISGDSSQNEAYNSNRANTQLQPPNSLFQPQLSIQNNPHSETINLHQGTHNTTIKQHISRIFQRISSKKKEGNNASQESAVDRSLSLPSVQSKKQPKSPIFSDGSGQINNSGQSQAAVSLSEKKPVEEEKGEESMQNIRVPSQTIPNAQGRHRNERFIKKTGKTNQQLAAQLAIPNRLFSLFKQKEKPAVYQISDDDE